MASDTVIDYVVTGSATADDDYEEGVGKQQWSLDAGVNDGQGIKIRQRPEVVAEESGKESE